MKKCPYCGAENDDQAKSCVRCKAELPHEEKETVTESEKTTKRKTRSETYGT